MLEQNNLVLALVSAGTMFASQRHYFTAGHINQKGKIITVLTLINYTLCILFGRINADVRSILLVLLITSLPAVVLDYQSNSSWYLTTGLPILSVLAVLYRLNPDSAGVMMLIMTIALTIMRLDRVWGRFTFLNENYITFIGMIFCVWQGFYGLSYQTVVIFPVVAIIISILEKVHYEYGFKKINSIPLIAVIVNTLPIAFVLLGA